MDWINLTPDRDYWWSLVNKVRAMELVPSIISGTSAVIWSKINFGLLVNITLKAVPFHLYAPFPALLPFFLNASWKSCSVRVFSTACDSDLIASVVSKWWPLNFISSQEVWDGALS
jgi:hypothetical protein